MNEMVTNVLAGLIGSAITFIVGSSYRYFQNRRGPLTGTWRQVIEEGYRREDEVKCKHSSKGIISGKIRRKIPAEQNDKVWQFRGRKKDDFVFMTFWNVNDAKNPESSGTIQLHMHNADHLEGFYVKSTRRPDAKEKDAILRQMNITHLSWFRE